MGVGKPDLSNQSFELGSAYEMGSNHGSSTHAYNTKNNGFGGANTVDQGFFGIIPGLEDIDKDDDNEEGLITSTATLTWPSKLLVTSHRKMHQYPTIRNQ